MDATIVWVDGGADSGPSQAIPSILQTWAAARGLKLVAPSDGGMHIVAVDPNIAKAIEDGLHQSREMLAQHDADGAERALAHAEGLLRAHPELPQAAWLLAEVERGWATRFSQLEPLDSARATRHWRAASVLDGGRAAGVGEPSASAEEKVPFHLDIAGDADDVRMDGEPVASGDRETRGGLHQLVARVGGNVVFAQWLAVARGTSVRVVLPSPAPCSQADLAGHTHCPSWVSVRQASKSPEAYVVRTCSEGACGAELVVATLPHDDRDTTRRKRAGFPPWAAWTLGATGAVALGVVVGVITYFALPPVEVSVFKTTKPQ
jgi:hypothetical protein